MMIQEQVAMFLGVKSFKRRYPELNRRAISGDERDYVLSKGLVTEALCDLGKLFTDTVIIHLQNLYTVVTRQKEINSV